VRDQQRLVVGPDGYSLLVRVDISPFQFQSLLKAAVFFDTAPSQLLHAAFLWADNRS
jgi:hypothetical protein